jgi:hypothetical protein
MTRPVITIEAQEIPSKKYSIGLVEPLFEERRLASKRMPTANSGQKVGYTTTQLMLAMCIKEVNGTPIKLDPRDPVAILRELPTDDTQFLLATFVSAFTLNDNLAEEVKEFSTTLKDGNQTGYFTIPKTKLPNSYGDIIFRRPRTDDEIKVQKRYPGEETNPGYSTAELFFAECITTIDGVEIEKPKDMITMFDNWSLVDQQYAQAVFNNIAYIANEDYEKAEDLGKNLRDRLKNLKLSTSKVNKDSTPMTKSS